MKPLILGFYSGFGVLTEKSIINQSKYLPLLLAKCEAGFFSRFFGLFPGR